MRCMRSLDAGLLFRGHDLLQSANPATPRPADNGLRAGIILASLISLLGPLPIKAEPLDVIVEGKIDDNILSDNLEGEGGRWQTKVQQMFNAKKMRIERRPYEYFDPTPSLHLKALWFPKDETIDKAGRISGAGRLVWQTPDSSVWDPAGVVSIFTGDVRNGRYEGKGELLTGNGLAYNGEWHNGRANGTGHLKLPSGKEYLGSFRDGKAEGTGREIDVTGEVFDGTFRAGLRDGHGKTKLPSGFTYDSRWTRGVEDSLSQRIRLAQIGSLRGIGGGTDVRMEVTVLRRPKLPQGVQLDDVVAYGSSNNGNEITVEPADKQLMDVWKGNGQLQTTIGHSTVRSGFFEIDQRYVDAIPPTFVLGFENHSTEPITVNALRLEVSESNTDNQPAIQLVDSADVSCGASYSVDYSLENFGESPAIGAEMHMSFSSPNTPPAPEFTKSIGKVTGRQKIDFEQELRKFDVNIGQLKRISDEGINCPSGSVTACLSRIRTNPLFGALGRQLSLNDLRIVVPASGTLEYTWIDNKGVSHNRSSPFLVNVGLGKFKQEVECGEGSAPEPQKVTAMQLHLDSSNYSLPLSFKRVIGAGQVTRISLPLSASKSSDHRFRIVATLATGEEVSSLPIKLLYFRPRGLPPNNN